MENKHTPGTWVATLQPEMTYRIGSLRPNSPVAFICELNSNKNVTEEELKSNANLIAAAPELLEALQKVIEWLYTPNKNLDADIARSRLLSYSPDLASLMAKGAAAIQKATI